MVMISSLVPASARCPHRPAGSNLRSRGRTAQPGDRDDLVPRSCRGRRGRQRNGQNGQIQRCATVFNNNGLGERGNLANTLRAILVDPEARDPAKLTVPGWGNRPVVTHRAL